MSSRLEAFYAKTVQDLGYRISPRLPLRYRLARCIQRIYDDERGEDLTFSEAEMMARMLQFSFLLGSESCTEYHTRVRGSRSPQIRITRIRGYPDGGVSIKHWKKILPHHPMCLRPRPRPCD